MAETSHLQILTQGTTLWNSWRQAHPDIQPDLSNVDLRNRNLSSVSFQNTNLSGTQLNKATLSSVDFQQANLSHSNLSGADCNSANFRAANLYKAQLRNIKCESGSFTYANLREANLSGANFNSVSLTHANLYKAILSGATMEDCDFQAANLQQASLPRVNFMGASLKQADLTGTILIGTIFTYAQLAETRCHHALMGWTQLHNIDLCQFQGLETVTHIGPSEVSLTTLYRCQQCLPETFLRAIGIPESWLTICTNPPTPLIPIPRCFICYCEPDRTFAERLQKDLRIAGVRCWLSLLNQAFDEDYKWKDSSFIDFLGSQTGSYTTLFDQIVLLLSKQAIANENDEQAAMYTMVDDALRKEQQGNRPVLFPLQLDATVAEAEFVKKLLPSTQDHSLRNFSHWTDEHVYQQAVSTLAYDLQWR